MRERHRAARERRMTIWTAMSKRGPDALGRVARTVLAVPPENAGYSAHGARLT
jgi:hypothetical protein